MGDRTEEAFFFTSADYCDCVVINALLPSRLQEFQTDVKKKD